MEKATVCPFCGEFPSIRPWHGGAKTKRMVLCEYDRCKVQPEVCGRTRAIAVKHWNKRAGVSLRTIGSTRY